MGGLAKFPSVSCNAPYMSAVIEADGSVRPCFFHQTVGSVRLEPLASIVKRNLPAFRENLTIASNPVCGDVLHLYLKIADGKITAASFKAHGCPPTLAASSVLTEIIMGLTLDDARSKMEEWCKYYNERPQARPGKYSPILLQNPGGAAGRPS